MNPLASEKFRESSSERGTALLLVTIFSVGLMAMAVTLIDVSNQGIREEANRHSMKALDHLLRAGIANSIDEINHYTSDNAYTDPDGLGYGTILGTKTDVYQGTQVTSPDGKNLGSYRATIKDVSGTITLTVVSAWPSFSNPVRTRGAQLALSQVTTPLFGGDRNPLSVNGPAGTPDPDTVKADSNAVLTIRDTTHSYNAVNTEDGAFNTAFKDTVIVNPTSGVSVSIEGADPNNPGGTAYYNNILGTTTFSDANALDTVSSDSAGLFSSATLAAMETAITAEVTALMADTNTITLNSTIGSDTDLDAIHGPNKVYILDYANGFKIDSNVTLSGTGTLLATGGYEVKVDSDATLTWEGNLYIWNSGSSFKIDSNATLNHTGNIFVDASGADGGMDLKFDSDSTAVIDGSLILLSSTDDAEFKFDSNTNVTVNGLVAALGNSIDVKFDSNANTTINGSFILGVASDSTASPAIEQLLFDSNSNTTFDYNGGFFDAAVAGLETTLGAIGAPTTTTSTTWTTVSYWESTGASLNSAQEADIAAGEANSGVGYKYDF